MQRWLAIIVLLPTCIGGALAPLAARACVHTSLTHSLCMCVCALGAQPTRAVPAGVQCDGWQRACVGPAPGPVRATRMDREHRRWYCYARTHRHTHAHSIG
jgi:hypothetical protein